MAAMTAMNPPVQAEAPRRASGWAMAVGFGLLVLLLGLASPAPRADDWGSLATISTTMGVNDGRLCMGESSRGDIGCPTYAPYITSAGKVGIGTVTPTHMLEISATGTSDAYVAMNTATNARAGIRLQQNGIERWVLGQSGANNRFTLTRFDATGAWLNNPLVVDGATGNISIQRENPGTWPSAQTALDISGTIRIGYGGENCDTNRLGAIKYQSGEFQVCRNVPNGWEALTTSGPNTLADRIVSASSYVQTNSNGTVSISGTTYVNVGGTNNAAFVLGSNAAGNRYSFIDLIGDTTYTTYGLRLIRHNTGPNADSFIQHRGTGALNLRTSESAPIIFHTNSSEAMRIAPDGYVGIGTNAPVTPLHIKGPLTIEDNTGSVRTLTVSASPDGILHTIKSSNSMAGYQFSNMAGPLMTIGNYGHVGISTTNPSATLHVFGTLRIANGNENCDTNRTGAIKYQSGDFHLCRNGTAWESLTSLGSGGTPDRLISGTTQAIAYQNTSLSLVTAGTERMVIGANGNIGVGTSNPTEKLEVSGSLRVGGATAGGVGAVRLIPGTAGTVGYTDYTTANGSSIGYIGWSASALTIVGRANYPIRLSPSNTQAMVLDTNGNVGISTTNPTTKLEVAGTVSATTLQLADNPSNPCNAANKGMAKVVNGRIYVCRYP